MTAPRSSIEALFNADRIAIIGGSSKPEKLGSWPFAALRNRGYRGKVYAVNPNYPTLFGHPCVPTIADLPDGVQAALIMLPAGPAVDAAEECARKGIKALVIGAQGIGETGEEGQALGGRLAEIAQTYDLAICGPNANGAANLARGLTLSFSPILMREERIPVGSVSIVSHSGAMIGTLLGRLLARDIGLRVIATCGNQLVLTMEDYVEYLADDPGTKVLVLFIEGFKHPEAMRRALRRCRESGKHVVAIKVGQSEAGQRAAVSHTGAIAGPYEQTLELLRREGVAVVEDLETLSAAVQLLTLHPWEKPAAKPAVVSISGGLAGLLSDMMSRHGVALPELSPEAAARLRALSDLSHPINPYDLAGRFAYDFVTDVLDVFVGDGFDRLVFGLGLLPDPVLQPLLKALADARRTKLEQFFVYWPISSQADRDFLRESGIAVTEDAESLLKAIGILSEATAPRRQVTAKDVAEPAVLKERGGLLDEHESKAALAELGLPHPRSSELAPDSELPAAAEVPFPWVVKGLSRKIAHKSEHGLVEIGIKDAGAAEEARRRVFANLRRADPEADRVLVEQMVSGPEAFIGFNRDPLLGPAVVIGAGGIYVELLRETIMLVPPFSRDEAVARLLATRFGRMLHGWRGKSYDLDGLAEAAVTIGDLALKVKRISSIDINPVFVQPDHGGIIVGDAKITVDAP